VGLVSSARILKRIRLIILGVGLVAICAGVAYLCQMMAFVIAGTGMRLAYYEGPVPPLTAAEEATIDGLVGGIFVRVFAVELAVLCVAWLVGFWFSRLAKKVERDSPTPWLVWGIRLALIGEGVVVTYGLMLSGYADHWLHAGEFGGDSVFVLALLLSSVIVGVWATLGVSRWSKLTLLACLSALSLYELVPFLRFAFCSLTDPWFHGSIGLHSLRGPILLAAIVLVTRSRRVRKHLAR